MGRRQTEGEGGTAPAQDGAHLPRNLFFAAPSLTPNLPPNPHLDTHDSHLQRTRAVRRDGGALRPLGQQRPQGQVSRHHSRAAAAAAAAVSAASRVCVCERPMSMACAVVFRCAHMWCVRDVFSAFWKSHRSRETLLTCKRQCEQRGACCARGRCRRRHRRCLVVVARGAQSWDRGTVCPRPFIMQRPFIYNHDYIVQSTYRLGCDTV